MLASILASLNYQNLIFQIIILIDGAYVTVEEEARGFWPVPDPSLELTDPRDSINI